MGRCGNRPYRKEEVECMGRCGNRPYRKEEVECMGRCGNRPYRKEEVECMGRCGNRPYPGGLDRVWYNEKFLSTISHDKGGGKQPRNWTTDSRGQREDFH